ncbi:GAF domain-containing SpoIIE family protein phosphatase [Olsenella sp. Marseille-P4559]|uniref:GAF domain-containing SpoIIE family protein phosphatase n=1 Tax=Olsenella sp. Marseille-P4559 TaxID=2364795 RepID=UPI001A9142E8|nr:GAF domain-containing SpoIIE family protein phosphatase [Olsenella sp. Marseille-P4559]
MAKNALSTRRVEGIGEGSLAATFARLLQLTCEAVVVFDGAGRVLLANDQASSLLSRAGGESLVGADVRTLFPPAGRHDPEAPFSTDALPFSVDGASTVVTMASLAGVPMRLRVRCDHVQASGETYLVVALPAESGSLEEHQGERDLEDLRRANNRLAGALRIVLDTLDSRDVQTLFSRVLEEITQTMEAEATIVYLAESDGFHLRGISKSLEGARVPHFMAYGKSVETLATRAGHALRLRVKPPQPSELRQGKIRVSEVVDEETREILRISKSLLPPFASFFAVPVWFGGHVIAIIEVGWSRPHPLDTDGARLLDSVAHYLSVQLMGAFSTMRQQRAERLAQRGSELREGLLDASEDDEDLLSRSEQAFVEAAEELDAVCVRLQENVHQSVLVAELPVAGLRSVPIDLTAAEEGHLEDGVAVVPVLSGTEVFSALHDLGEPCVGALVDAGRLAGERRCCLVLRPDGAEPLDAVELAFLGRLARDVRDILLGEEKREQDKRISQALQTGMRNALQHVDGLTAQGIYSSATESAFVGGDFYDLIRLPGRRACVIVGDVSGKGVESASVSAAVKTALGAYSWEGLAPARMVRSLNEFLLGFSRIETFATLFVGIVDLAAATLTYCSAGHPPAVLVRASTRQIDLLDVQSGVVGAFHDMEYRDGVASLCEGDILFLYTDGTTEARSPSGAFFGDEGLRDMVSTETSGDFDGLLDRCLARLDDFTGRNLNDDVSMIAVRFDGLG